MQFFIFQICGRTQPLLYILLLTIVTVYTFVTVLMSMYAFPGSDENIMSL